MRRFVPLASLLGLVLLLAASRAGSADEPTASKGAWHFQVRVVRVLTAEAATAESDPPWATGTDGTPMVATPYPDLLGRLKERGETTVLLDQRVTARDAVQAEVVQNLARTTETFDSRDVNNERWKASLVNSGCQAKLLAQSGGELDYEVHVQWALPTGQEAAPLLQGTTRWRGTCFALEGRTLVLSYREQVVLPDQSLRGHEIYAFVTATYVSR